MAALTRQTVSKAGIDISYASAAGGGDTIANGTSADALVVLNGDASPTTVTIVYPGNNFAGTAQPDTTKTVAAGATSYIKLDPAYNSSGVTSITYSSVTSLSVAVISM